MMSRMRAKKIQENVGFHKTGSIRSSLDIGGIDLSEEIDKLRMELESEILDLRDNFDEKAYEYFFNTMYNKKVNAALSEVPSGKGWTSLSNGRKTIVVVNIEYYDLSKDSIIVGDSDGKQYRLNFNEKIYVE